MSNRFMKSINEFLFLSKNLGIFYSFFYFGYKVVVKIQFSRLIKEFDQRKNSWLSKINSHLFIYNNKKVFIHDREMIEINLPNQIKIYLRPLTSDLDVFYQIFGREEYKSVINIYKQFFSNAPKNILDLGANIGLASIYFANIYKDAKFKLVEPFFDNVQLAELNLELNQINFSILQAGIWNK